MSVKLEHVDVKNEVAEFEEDPPPPKKRVKQEIINVDDEVEECLEGSLPKKKRVKQETIKEEDPPTCCLCDRQPCLLVALDPMLESLLKTLDGSNRYLRHQMYVFSTKVIHGYLGQGNRRKLPDCVEERIHSLAPDTHYTGFKEAQN